MQQEYDSMIRNHTWKLVDLPFGKTPITTRWVFNVKKIIDGNVQKLKGSSCDMRISIVERSELSRNICSHHQVVDNLCSCCDGNNE